MNNSLIFVFFSFLGLRYSYFTYINIEKFAKNLEVKDISGNGID